MGESERGGEGERGIHSDYFIRNGILKLVKEVKNWNVNPRTLHLTVERSSLGMPFFNRSTI